MREIFGTDGIRNRVNEYPMTADFVMHLAAFLGSEIIRNADNNSLKKVVIGKDTRRSCYVFEAAIEAGFASAGVDVVLTGPIPTPAISMLVKSLRCDMGIMISASHNKFIDNGIKIFDKNGLKISSEYQTKIEKMMQSTKPSDFFCEPSQTGMVKRLDDVVGRYIEAVKSSFPSFLNLSGIKIALDLANGAGYKIAPAVFTELGAKVFVFNNDPNGININLDCGSTYPEKISEFTKQNGCFIGFALDGDGDRLIVSDEFGNIIDGDYIIGAITTYFLESKKLRGSCVVSTIMSNLGLEEYISSLGLDFVRTAVGDKNVLYKMIELDSNIGGEQSGHIILSDYSLSGDGILSAIQILAFLLSSGKKASDISKLFDKYPQVLRSVAFVSNKKLEEATYFASNIKDARVIVRKSGTEPVVRIMVEAKTIKIADDYANKIENFLI